MARRSKNKEDERPKPLTDDTTIRFYRSNERPYGAFSNLYRRPVEFEGVSYPTSEHAYQAGKALKPAVRDWIQSAPTPALAAMAAHGLYTWDVVPNWADIKFGRNKTLFSSMSRYCSYSRTINIITTNGMDLAKDSSRASRCGLPNSTKPTEAPR